MQRARNLALCVYLGFRKTRTVRRPGAKWRKSARARQVWCLVQLEETVSETVSETSLRDSLKRTPAALAKRQGETVTEPPQGTIADRALLAFPIRTVCSPHGSRSDEDGSRIK